MVLAEIIEKIRGLGNQEEEEDIPDDVTRDKYLRSLRRQRRIQNEEIEKVQLKKKIATFNKEREKKYLWGIKDKKETKRNLLTTLKQKKEVKILSHGRKLIKAKKAKNHSMLDRGNLL